MHPPLNHRKNVYVIIYVMHVHKWIFILIVLRSLYNKKVQIHSIARRAKQQKRYASMVWTVRMTKHQQG